MKIVCLLFVCNAWHCDHIVWIRAFRLILGFQVESRQVHRRFLYPKPPSQKQTPQAFPMSRRRSTSSTRVPATDRDVVMGPPAPASSAAVQQTNQDVNEKYRKLKRRFFELEEVCNPLYSFSRSREKES
jgi:hypothetical protein